MSGLRRLLTRASAQLLAHRTTASVESNCALCKHSLCTIYEVARSAGPASLQFIPRNCRSLFATVPASEESASSPPVVSGNYVSVAKATDTQGRERPKQHELVAAFTCNLCGTRSARSFSKIAFERGVVIARCGGCEVQHLLSDRLGWFGDKGSIEDFLREKGESIRKHVDGTVEIEEEDLAGWSAKP